MDKTGPIGIFDSGVGGLTVVKALLDKMPQESFIYFGDTANVPYGSKTKEQLFSYAHKIVDFLLSRQVKAILVACGTHSSVTLPEIENRYPVPMLGVVKPGARAAVRTTFNDKIGIIATEATINSHAYTNHIKAFAPGSKVFANACSRFVPLIEAGQLDGKETRSAVEEYLEPLLQQGIDTLVLGCTHYPFLAPVIRNFAGQGVNLVDPAYETVEEMAGMLDKLKLSATDCSPIREFYVSGNDESFYKVGKLLIGDVIQKVQRIEL